MQTKAVYASAIQAVSHLHGAAGAQVSRASSCGINVPRRYT